MLRPGPADSYPDPVSRSRSQTVAYGQEIVSRKGSGSRGALCQISRGGPTGVRPLVGDPAVDLVVQREDLGEVGLATLGVPLGDVAPGQPVAPHVALGRDGVDRSSPSTGTAISSGPSDSSVTGAWKMPNASPVTVKPAPGRSPAAGRPPR